VGHISGPLDFPPWAILSWKSRFDHPDKTFRTLYCAEQRQTAFREVLADFRPNAKARAEYRELYGDELPAPRITPAWRATKVLAQGTLEILRGDLVDVDDSTLRQQFTRIHADVLARHGMDHLDIAQIRSKDRTITQMVTRFLADQGAAGVVYGSNLDDRPCAALFEARSLLVPAPGFHPEPLTASHPDLVSICDEFGLVLDN
jgi:hypothetical protein